MNFKLVGVSWYILQMNAGLLEYFITFTLLVGLIIVKNKLEAF